MLDAESNQKIRNLNQKYPPLIPVLSFVFIFLATIYFDYFILTSPYLTVNLWSIIYWVVAFPFHNFYIIYGNIGITI